MIRSCLLALLATPLAALAQPAAPSDPPLVPLHIGAEWRYHHGEHDPYSGDYRARNRTIQATGTTEVGGTTWYRVEETVVDPDGYEEAYVTVWHWRSAPEGFHEFYGDDLTEETVDKAFFYKYPAVHGEVYVTRSWEDGGWGDEERVVHVLGVALGDRQTEAYCYASPPDEFGRGGFDPEDDGGRLVDGSCFVPGVGRVLLRHEFGGSDLVTEAGTYVFVR